MAVRRTLVFAQIEKVENADSWSQDADLQRRHSRRTLKRDGPLCVSQECGLQVLPRRTMCKAPVLSATSSLVAAWPKSAPLVQLAAAQCVRTGHAKSLIRQPFPGRRTGLTGPLARTPPNKPLHLPAGRLPRPALKRLVRSGLRPLRRRHVKPRRR